ncbi:MAG: class I SAM-dependent rRNA methyltransferase [Bdellovibrionaceae bacterium]|nr:class I SAM-dependent rRNA methyltransferase [Bdellovibrionales bacterium]MCB9254087.1 class I SAM-dependent rRNA methyltransferase [Pseudobdellovibrionaceae bacterium]
MSTALAAALQIAWERRQPLFENSETNAYRLFSVGEENVRGLSADRYGQLAVVYRALGKRPLSDEALSEIADFYLAQTNINSVYVKDVQSDRSHAQPTAARHLGGAPFEGDSIVSENGLSYKVSPLESFSSGLFMDQREQRLAFRKESQSLEVLNTFAYTCSFSVACAVGGAKVTSVDISKRYLDWGKENFLANGLNPEDHEFFPNDTIGFLKGASKRGRKFDLVILDPPSFARNRKGTFSIKRDAEDLLRLAGQVVKPGGKLYFSSNLTEWNNDSLSRLMRITLPQARITHAAPLPLDFQYEEHPVSRILAVLNPGRRP